LFRSEFFFRTTQELEYLFFLSRNTRIFFPELNIRLYDKNSGSDYFFFLHQNENIFFSNIGNQNIFLEKNHNPPPPFKLNGRSPRVNMLRKFKFILDRKTLEKIYLTFIRPILEYADVVCDNKTLCLINKLENVQIEAARITVVYPIRNGHFKMADCTSSKR
jgi:hypothetical protein